MHEISIIELQRELFVHLSYEELVNKSVELNQPIAPPITSTISITSKCNSDCIYCGFRSSLNKHVIQQPKETILSIIDSLALLGTKLLTFSGGEPLLRADMIEIIRYAVSKGITINLLTNGILFTPKIADDLFNAGTSNIVLSLDSMNSEINSFQRGVHFKFSEQALKTLLYFKKKNPRKCSVAVTSVITKQNYHGMIPFVQQIYHDFDNEIMIHLQPYHRVDQNDLNKVVDRVSKLKPEKHELDDPNRVDDVFQDETIYKYLKEAEKDLIVSPAEYGEIKDIFENVITLKNQGYLINNSENYLRSFADFFVYNKLPKGFNCLTGYTGVYIRENLDVLTCWSLPAIGNLADSSLESIWFSDQYATRRKEMFKLKCPGCLLLCHSEKGWYDYYNHLFKNHNHHESF